MSNEITIPFAGQKPAAALAAALPNAGQESLSEGIGSSYGIIGYKGKTWSLRYRGETHVFLRPDDASSPANHIDVIILRAAGHKSKSFYPDGYSPEASAGKPPACASMNGIVPDQGVADKQSDTCALCPQNVWRTNAKTGRKERPCTDYKRLAVLLVPSLSKQVLGSPLVEPVFLRIPPASLNDLAVFGDTMASEGWHFATFVTRISFDPKMEHPKMVFKPIQALTDAESPVVLEQRESPIALRITGEDQPEALSAPGPAKPLGFAPEKTQEAAPPPKKVAKAPDPKPEPEHVDTGFLELTANKPATKVTANGNGAHIAAPADDTGDPAESDDDLDAKLAGLLNTK